MLSLSRLDIWMFLGDVVGKDVSGALLSKLLVCYVSLCVLVIWNSLPAETCSETDCSRHGLKSWKDGGNWVGVANTVVSQNYVVICGLLTFIRRRNKDWIESCQNYLTTELRRPPYVLCIEYNSPILGPPCICVHVGMCVCVCVRACFVCFVS